MRNSINIPNTFLEIMKVDKDKFHAKFLALLLLLVGFAYSPTQAQINVNVNIGSQSLWGPVGYDYVEYYYMPQIGVYYYVPTAQFIYLSGSNWIFANSLPGSYNVNLYNTYKVVVNEQNPYLQNNVYVTKYAKYKNGGPKQVVIRDSREAKYYVVKGHPKHGQNNNNNSNTGNNNHTNNTGNNDHNNNKSGGNGNHQEHNNNQPGHSVKTGNGKH